MRGVAEAHGRFGVTPDRLAAAAARALLNPRDMTRGLELLDADDPHVERIWQSLELHAHPSYFLSWGFIRHWLDALPAEERPSLAVICDRGEPTAAFFLARRRVRHHLVSETSALYFNATGSPAHDQLAIEHNGMLAAPGARRSLAYVLDLLPGEWDELYLPAIDRYAFDDLGAAPLDAHYKVRIEREASAPFVDLDAVRGIDEGGHGPLRLLIAGRVKDASTARELREAASRDPRVRLHLGFLERDEIGVHLRACDLVVLPYREILNSGSALLTQSFERPVLMPRLGPFTDLVAQFGAEFVLGYDRLGSAVVERALEHAVRLRGTSNRARLASASPEMAAERTLAAYRAVLGHGDPGLERSA